MKTFEEIGEELGISWQTVQKHYHSAMRKLRENYTEEEIYAILMDGREDNQTLHEAVVDAMHQSTLEGKDSLGDFWREENNV